jgi:tyrosyl-tRNA synthetase
MILKKELGEAIVELYHSRADAVRAREDFEMKFSKKEVPDDIPVSGYFQPRTNDWIVKVMLMSGCRQFQ